MESIGVKELRDNLSRILKMVEQGRIIRVLRHGKSVVELRPANIKTQHDIINRLRNQDLTEGGSGVIGPIKTIKNRKAGTQVSDFVLEDRR